ncbi:CobD/CbiB family cobalamin biosynthesis protein [Natronomonas sp. EA1]|uniref:CobD/CbiB family cobalamin biosynthesis protein n=1 Tax=Natronomonas sp. EA1 TaxID=3421655 RepID=UPI003EBADBD5
MSILALAAVALAFALDAAFAEPPTRVHPVALFGRLVAPLDRAWRFPFATGVAIAVVLPLLAAGVAGGTTAIAVGGHPLAGAALAGLWLFATSSRRMLVDVSNEVLTAIASDTDEARHSIRALVGRDTSELSDAELRSGVVESAAENLADGLVAPLLAFALGALVSLPVATGAAAWVKGVNTLDSMLGYPEKRHGTASARLDDLVMWLPARASAACIAFAAGTPGALARARGWADEPPSPNSGWPMATLAAVLDTRLAKPGAYTLNPEATLPSPETAARGVRVVDRAALLAVVLAGVVAGLSGVVAWS